MKRPNILFLLTDQQTLRAMSAYGNPHLKTPNLDALAAGGIRFERSYCAVPVCGPSRSCLLTGRTAHETGVLFNNIRVKPEIPNLGERFRAGGYRTAYSGKWHLAQAGSSMTPPDWRGFDFLPLKDAEKIKHGADIDAPVADAAVRFIENAPSEPWLLVASFVNPHDICGWSYRNPTEHPHAASYPPLPPNFEPDPDEPEFIRDARARTYYGNENNWTVDWTETQWRCYLNAYYRFAEDVDVQIGRVLDALKRSGLEGETLVLFTSDHGEGVAAHRLIVKLMLYEEQMKVPLVLRYPGRIPAGACDATHLASGVDVLPTLCDYAGIEVPAAVSGVSLRSVIEDPGNPGRAYVAAELEPDTEDASKKGRMVRTERYKYVAFSYGARPEQFFDLEDDPGETRNLAAAPEARAVLVRHRTLLAEWCRRTGDTFEVPAG